MNIFVCESGEYDSYSVGPFFTTKEAAQKYCDDMNAVEGDDEKHNFYETEVLDESPAIYKMVIRSYNYMIGSEGSLAFATFEPQDTESWFEPGQYLTVRGTDEKDVLRVYKAEAAKHGLPL